MKNTVAKFIKLYIRYKACQLTAQSVQGSCLEYIPTPRLWALCVFFEAYMHEGSEGTKEDFGYKEVEKLKIIK